MARVSWGYGRGDQGGIDVEGDRIDVHEDGLCAHVGNGTSRGNKAERRSDDFVAGTNARGHQGENESVRARRTTNGKPCAELRGHFLFEEFHLWTKNKILAFKNARDRSHYFFPNGGKLRPEVQEIKRGLGRAG